MFCFSYIYYGISEDYKVKIDAIIEYIATDQYQSLDYGYGIVRTRENKFHSIGWSVHLPLYTEVLSCDYFRKGLIHRMVILSRFKNDRIRCWLRTVLDELSEFRDDKYIYNFPSELLPEVKNSYFMNGRHTSLNENRRSRNGRNIESTFYACLVSENLFLTNYSKCR